MRDLQPINGPDSVMKESKKVLAKWDRTGLLEGLQDSRNNRAKSNMARLLENQAVQTVREHKVILSEGSTDRITLCSRTV